VEKSHIVDTWVAVLEFLACRPMMNCDWPFRQPGHPSETEGGPLFFRGEDSSTSGVCPGRLREGLISIGEVRSHAL